MSPRNYIYGFAVLLTVLLALTALFDRVIDPFWYYRDVTLPGINDVKTEFYTHERHVKPSIVQREQPAVLIFGSSYSEMGFDPLHPALRAIGKSYNFALSGAPWSMVSCDVEFGISRDAGLRQIILGIHTSAMPVQDCSSQIERMEHPDERAFLLSFSALEASVETVLGSARKEPPSHTAEGRLLFYLHGKAGTATRFSEDLPKCNIRRAGSKRAGTQAAEGVDLRGLRKIIRMAVGRGITMKLVVYPRHALAIEREYQCGQSQRRWRILKQIVALVAKEGRGLVEVWDFEGYHDIGTEHISDAPAAWWHDPFHFKSKFGDIMLNEMFAIKPPVYGVRLTPANLPGHMAAAHRQRAAYLNSHPEFLRQLESLSPVYGK